MTTQTHVQDARTSSITQLPGFGLPVNTMPELNLFYSGEHGAKTHDEVRISRFPNAIMDWKAEGLTLRAREMLSVMDSLTDKPEWRSKVIDEDIVAKWRQEAPKGWSDGMFDYVSD